MDYIKIVVKQEFRTRRAGNLATNPLVPKMDFLKNLPCLTSFFLKAPQDADLYAKLLSTFSECLERDMSG